MKHLRHLVALIVLLSINSYAATLQIINNTSHAIQYQFVTLMGSASPGSGTLAPFSQSRARVSATYAGMYGGHLDVTQENATCSFNYKGLGSLPRLTQFIHATHAPACRADTLISNGFADNGMESKSDCEGADNCVIINPQTDWVQNALSLQRSLDLYEPFSKNQFLGTHNSGISSAYHDQFVSDVDPNQTLTITQQLDNGIRKIELDIMWDAVDHVIRLCHARGDVPAFGCKSLLSTRLKEINQWIDAHPDQILLLYIDINKPLGDKDKVAEQLLNEILGNRMYSRKDIPAGQNVDLNKITKAQLLNAHKNYLLTAYHTGKGDFNNSDIVFLFNQQGNKTIYESIIQGFIEAAGKVAQPWNETHCITAESMHFLPADAEHASIWRLYEDRTFFSGTKKPFSKDIGVRASSMWNSARCPINLFDLDELIPGDYRLAAWVWSWREGYPVEQGQNFAVIDPNRHRFINDVATAQVRQALCYQSVTQQWRTVNVPTATADAAIAACKNQGDKWQFAVPTTSYQMYAALAAIAQQGSNTPVLVNYFRQQNHQWLANQGQRIFAMN